MRTVAWAEPVQEVKAVLVGDLFDATHVNEPATEITSLANGHTTQMSADTEHDKPLWPLRPALVTLGVPQGLPIRVLRLLNLIRCTMSDEHWLATPFDNHILAFRNVGYLNFF